MPLWQIADNCICHKIDQITNRLPIKVTLADNEPINAILQTSAWLWMLPINRSSSIKQKNYQNWRTQFFIMSNSNSHQCDWLKTSRYESLNSLLPELSSSSRSLTTSEYNSAAKLLPGANLESKILALFLWITDPMLNWDDVLDISSLSDSVSLSMTWWYEVSSDVELSSQASSQELKYLKYNDWLYENNTI